MLEDLAALLERAGADVLFIKGPLFAHRFYGDVDARGLADLDVLVRTPADLDRVEAALVDGGFRRAFRVLGGRRMARWFAHHFRYTRDSLSVDVHWVLHQHPAVNIDYPRLWATSARIPFAGRTYASTSSEYELVLQILGVVSDLQVGKFVTRSIVDIHRILQTIEPTADWNEFLEIRKRERILRPSLWVLALVLTVLDCREQFPRLGSALAATTQLVSVPAHAQQMIVDSRPFALGQKLMALRLYETPLALCLSWWLVSLPFRMAVYASDRQSDGGEP